MTNLPLITVHNLEPMTTRQLADIKCGHCRHELTMHVTSDKGNTQCAICHCFRGKGEDILKPHNFGGAA